MATNSVYEIEQVALQDGSEVELRPASIKLLKAGNKELEKLSEVTSTDDTLDVLLKTCIVLLKKQRPELADPESGYELAEDLFDLETVYRVIEVMLGVKLNDPKMVEAAMRAAEASQS